MLRRPRDSPHHHLPLGAAVTPPPALTGWSHEARLPSASSKWSGSDLKHCRCSNAGPPTLVSFLFLFQFRDTHAGGGKLEWFVLFVLFWHLYHFHYTILLIF